MLHIIKTVAAVTQANQYATAGDNFLLIEDAVYASNSQHFAFANLPKQNVAVLIEDCVARGIAQRISPSIEQLDYNGFVRLTVAQDKSATWA
ncbi:sulfurtransferase complex subunit TusB [Vibrio sp. SCSIO 43136]|uniref:sulfurtransferase complex subunit TusB n=1 Tax=Vibrio sp. SCSIO 43136 TaxID=2819101 RepID=UPI002075C38F|nr:sulfurtransferase complex subunit TusB [Vibrio sp. SCSIO 43136]USD65528.1 sulfurtransferase complex subunit TusB [Vibrio sp. SCSIO 43136]